MKSLSLSKPHLLVMVGMPGAGKSFFASQFSDMFNAPRVSHDLIRATVSQDQPTFNKAETESVEKIAHDQLDQLLSTGATIVVDGGSETRTSRQEITRRARAKGYKTLFIWVQTDPATAKQRATVGVRGRNDQHVLLTQAQYETALRRFTVPNDSESFVVISGKHTFATQARTILKKLSEPRAEQAANIQPPTERPGKSGYRVTIN